MSGLEPTCDGGDDCIMHALYFVFTRVNLLSIFVLFVLFVRFVCLCCTCHGTSPVMFFAHAEHMFFAELMVVISSLSAAPTCRPCM